MRNLRQTEQKGFSQVFLLFGMLLIAISLPLATKLVQQNQENRSNAATNYPAVSCASSNVNDETCFSSYIWKCARTGEGTSGEGTYAWIVTTSKCKLSNGSSCTKDKQCSSGHCSHGLCVASGETCVLDLSSGKILRAPETYYCGLVSTNKNTLYVCSGGVMKESRDCSSSQTCKNSSTSASCVTSSTAVTGVSVSPMSLSMEVNDNETLSATVSPSSAITKTVTWISSDDSVAIVSSGGKVTAKSVGHATITVKTTSGAKTANVYVTVKAGSCSSSNCGACTDPSDCTSKSLCAWNQTIRYCESTNVCSASKCANCSRTQCGTTTGCAYNSSTEVCETDTSNVLYGTPSSNSSKCKSLGGVCATFSKALSKGASCKVTGYDSVVGTVETGFCSGDAKTVCCTTVTTAVAPPAGSSSTGGSNNNGGSGDNGGSTTVDPTGITLSPTTLPLTVGSSGTITATVAPSNATDKTVTWSSSNTAVATVNTNGLVTAVASGSAVITAKTSNSKTATTTVTVTNVSTVTTPKVSFKFSLMGIGPSATCLDQLGNLSVEVINSPEVYQLGLSTDFTKTDSVNSTGDQIFQVSGLVLDSKFTSVGTNNKVKIKGPFHSKRRMCTNNQKSKLSEATVCDISLTSDTVYDFSEYQLLTGDIDQNGIINLVDYGIVKTNYDAGADVECGLKGDLNLDGKVNNIDAALIKVSLSSVDDE